MGTNSLLQTTLLIIALGLFLIRYVYWKITEIIADREKPKQGNLHRKQKITFTAIMTVIIFFQAIGVHILPFTKTDAVAIIGFCFVLIGIFISIAGRYTLGTNWAHALEYQIKKKHELVTDGIYKYIRHPIYSGFFFSILGVELLFGSYLSLVYLLLAIPLLNFQAGREEKLLTEHFGKQYEAYKERTSRFIPLLW